MTEKAATRIEPIAKTVLPALGEVERSCLQQERERQEPSISRPSNDQAAALFSATARTSRIISSELIQLAKEPIVAYVRLSHNGAEKIFLICRNYIPTGVELQDVEFTSRNAPIGRASAVDIGERFTFTTGRDEHIVEVIERHTFRPVKLKNWDATDNEFFLDIGEFSVPSLVAWMDQHSEVASDVREELRQVEQDELRQLQERGRIREGRRRQVIQTMQLRDQAILDSVQDEVFRLPINSRFVLTGGPGTGKTTVLIRRISLKTKPEFLTDEEKATAAKVGLSGDGINELLQGLRGWLLFTPSDLLKVYLKEALNREEVPAADERIQTWDTYQRSLARPECFGLLSVGNRRGPFRYTEERLLTAKTNKELLAFGEEFRVFLQADVVASLEASVAATRGSSDDPPFANALNSAFNAIRGVTIADFEPELVRVLRRLATYREVCATERSVLRSELEEIAETVLTGLEVVASVNGIVDKAEAEGSAERGIRSSMEEDDESEEDDPFEDDEQIRSGDLAEITSDGSDSVVRAKRHVVSAIRAHARALATGRRPRPLQQEIIQKIEAHIPRDVALQHLGERVVELGHAQRWTRGIDFLLSHVPQAYKRYRRGLIGKDSAGQLEGHKEDLIRGGRICADEIDLLLYIITRFGRIALSMGQRALQTNTESRLLERMKEHLFGQIVIDEVTDFSSYQIGCMYGLTHPGLGALSMAGDLMQRVAPRGLQAWDQLEGIIPEVAVRELKTTYRQSTRLLGIAKKLSRSATGEQPTLESAYRSKEIMPAPLLFQHEGDSELHGGWIVERILEIYAVDNSLPSIAVCVPNEREIDQAYDLIAVRLSEHGIQAEKCPEGKIGDGQRVRVFSVDYLKGLEFEGVFLLDIDMIETERPDLVDKFLYVAITRAALFLGVTTRRRLPKCLLSVEEAFERATWADYAA